MVKPIASSSGGAGDGDGLCRPQSSQPQLDKRRQPAGQMHHRVLRLHDPAPFGVDHSMLPPTGHVHDRGPGRHPATRQWHQLAQRLGEPRLSDLVTRHGRIATQHQRMQDGAEDHVSVAYKEPGRPQVPEPLSRPHRSRRASEHPQGAWPAVSALSAPLHRKG
jgi:hypothetical protein